jgi:phosphoribosylanthranilate isomerase
MNTRVKICGITRRQDAEYAAKIGVDAIGLVFYEPSPRYVSAQQAQQIIQQLPPFLTTVGLFVNAEPDYVRQCLSQVSLDVLQFHGDESAEYCEHFSKPYLKALRMREETDLQVEAERYRSASALLLDSYQPGIPGGTGMTFDWSMIKQIEMPIILAGGLEVSNVAEAINTVRPYGVDVSGGVESAKGIKNNDKMNAFVQEVRDV